MAVVFDGEKGDRKRVLVLDDEQDVATTICTMAKTAGHDANHTSDRDAFLDILTSWEPTHVVVDLQLSDRDGVEILHTLAEMNCQAAVIIISGLGERILFSAARAATESGLFVAGTLAKPISRSNLLRLLTADVLEPALPREASLGNRYPDINRERITQALNSREFVTHFQPKISCANDRLVGFECLARWPQEHGHMIPPDLFISVAERSGLIHELTRQIFDYALSHMLEIKRASDAKFALNLSPINLNDETFPRWLLDRCEAYGVAPSHVVLELTETASMSNPLSLLEKLIQFRIRGFHLSIDDFGVGYSSLVQLARLPFSEMKIDQIFVNTLPVSVESRKIVRAIVGLGSSLGLNVVAEGVEDAWTLDFLCDVGCHEAQGYFIAKPMDTLAASSWNYSPWRNKT